MFRFVRLRSAMLLGEHFAWFTCREDKEAFKKATGGERIMAFNMRSAQAMDRRHLAGQEVQRIAGKMPVVHEEVLSLPMRLSGKNPLNQCC